MTPAQHPAHAPMDRLAVAGGELQVGGIGVRRLALVAGGTPFYAYDRAVIAAEVARLRALLVAPWRLHYAVKANPMPALLGFMAGIVDGFDVASGGELGIALDAGMDAANIGFAGPGKRTAELRQAVAAGVLLSAESAGEIERLAAIGSEAGRPARLAIRINPAFELKRSGMKMGGGARPFGIDEEAVPGLLRRWGSNPGLDFEGFHVYAGSQNLNGGELARSLRESYAVVTALAAHASRPPRRINLGGGFGIPYFPGEARIDLAPVAAAMAEVAADAAARFAGASLILELGRYLVGEAGVYVTRIVERKVSRGHTFLVTDGGLNHHLAASGNFGQVLRKNYPVVIADRMGEAAADAPVSVVGPLCTPLDILADGVRLPHAEPGNLVAVLQSGAYGASASPQAFLGHAPVREVLV